MELVERLSADMKVGVKFDDRIYKLEEPIDVTVVISPQKDLSLREVKLSLVCRERFTIWAKPTVYDRNVNRGGTIAYGSSGESVEERELDTVTVWSGLKLKAANTASQRVTVRLKNGRPIHASEAKELRMDGTAAWGFEWLLVVDIDTKRGWDVQSHHKVKVYFD